MGGQWHRTSRGIHISLWKWELELRIGQRVFVHKRNISAFKRVDILSDRLPYVLLICPCFPVPFLNVLTPTEDKID
jgi:hypothetical protein